MISYDYYYLLDFPSLPPQTRHKPPWPSPQVAYAGAAGSSLARGQVEALQPAAEG